MSAFTIEQVLWEICSFAEQAESFKADPDKHLRAYRLTDDERTCIRELRVRRLANMGVNQMLLVMTWNTVKGLEATPEYIRQMNRAA